MIFIDTSWFYAIEVEPDKYHEEAMKTKKQLAQGTYGVPYTSNYILDETVTLLRFKASLKAAVIFKEKIKNSKVLRVVRISEDLEAKAYKKLKKFRDLPLSFTDCTSFAVMESLNVKRVFTFDNDFKKAGYVVFPKLK